MIEAALELSGIDKRFGGVVALTGVSLTVRPGTVHALLGENGAGKTTLARIAFGLDSPDGGTIRIAGATSRIRSPADAIRHGLAMVQQHLALVPVMTVLENVALGSRTRLDEATLDGLADRVGLEEGRRARVESLGAADRQRVELMKAMARGARLLILDEPTSSLPPADAEMLLGWVRDFRGHGGSVVIITHKLREAFSIADDVTVLRRGEVRWVGPAGSATADVVLRAMLGQPLQERSRRARRETERGAVVASAAGIDLHDERGLLRVRNASLEVRAGEVVGVAGVEGSGVRELVHAIAGRLKPVAGRLDLPGRIGFIPDDCQREALLLEETVADNVALRGAGSRRGWLQRAAMEREAAVVVAAGGVLVPDVRAPVSALSGGNQQRLVLARELAGNPPLVVAANPTRGLDAAAAMDAMRKVSETASGDSAVVYHSADLDELIGISDRVLVVHAGQVREVPVERALVGRAMLGAS